jgi:hypothetical protein
MLAAGRSNIRKTRRLYFALYLRHAIGPTYLPYCLGRLCVRQLEWRTTERYSEERPHFKIPRYFSVHMCVVFRSLPARAPIQRQFRGISWHRSKKGTAIRLGKGPPLYRVTG